MFSELCLNYRTMAALRQMGRTEKKGLSSDEYRVAYLKYRALKRLGKKRVRQDPERVRRYDARMDWIAKMSTKAKPFVIVVGMVVILFFIGMGLKTLLPQFQTNLVRPPARAPYPYTPNICDDAYATEVHHDNGNPDYFDVVLHEKCFSGFVGLPLRWRGYRGQFVGPDRNVWVAYWYRGEFAPKGPLNYDQVMMAPQNETHTSNELRLQGKGTLRFYRITE